MLLLRLLCRGDSKPAAEGRFVVALEVPARPPGAQKGVRRQVLHIVPRPAAQAVHVAEHGDVRVCVQRGKLVVRDARARTA